MPQYLTSLTLRLAAGAQQIDAATRETHAQWIVSQQCDGGGFAGREGPPDPYYTAFALRSLWILGGLDERVAIPTGAFLRDRLTRKDSIVDLVSLVFAAAILELAAGEVVIDDGDDRWRNNVASLLASLRCDDGGFAKTPEGRAGSTYQTFLSVLCHELIGIDVPQPDAIIDFLQSQKQDGGGYREIRAAKRAGVNPTAAAIGTFVTLDRLKKSAEADTIDFLAEMQTSDGGLTANTRIPFADLLSSCTGAITLRDLDAMDCIDVARLNRYAQSMQVRDDGGRVSGGFVGFELDQTADVEYTFYGLSTLSIVQQ
ncbi:MAG: prenyltransferase/squalene oxidase repeat-containing protein [Planctomycetota bacterium]